MSPRDRILDAAAIVMRERGLARATTKEIARAAGYSEAMLYKYFEDKQEIFLGVLAERVPGPAAPAELAGTGTVRGNLTRLTAALLAFYTRTFPMAASIFSAPELLAAWRAGMDARGAGPRGPQLLLEDYLDREVALGRVDERVDGTAVAVLLCGAAMQQAFLTCFAGHDRVPDADALAARLVDGVALEISTARPSAPATGPSRGAG